MTVQAHRRALLALDGLAKVMTARGHTIEIQGSGNDLAISLQVQGEAMMVSIVELLDPIPHTLTPEEQRPIDRGDKRAIPKNDLVPGGRLRIMIPDASGGRCSCSDTKKHRVEAMLAHLVVAAEAEPAFRAQIRAEQEERRREAELRRQRAEAEQERQRQEDERAKRDAQRAEELEERIEGYRLARDVREYVGETKRLVDEAKCTIIAGGGLDEFIQWALAYAD